MSNETLFYICGCVLAVSAVLVTFAGLKLKDFPGKALPLVVIWFALFVGGATTFAVLHAQDEESAKAAELEQAGKEFEKGETSGPYENEGALGGETERAEEEAEKEGSVEEEEPVGPTEDETGKKPSNKGEGEAKGGGGAAAGKGQSKGGGAGAAGGASASTTLQLEASETALEFDTTSLTAKAGKVTIDFKNPSAIPHDVVIEQNGKELAKVDEITESEASATTELQPGTYTFFCSVPGHRQAGMEGTLTVK